MAHLSFLIRAFVAALLIVCFSTSNNPATSQGIYPPNLPEFDLTAWVPDGPVNAIEIDPPSGNTFLGGEFSSINPYTGHMLAFNLTSPLAPRPIDMPKIDGPVYAIAGDSQAGWYIGGDFQHAGGETRLNLLRLNPDFSLDEKWRPSTDGPVYALLLSSDRIFVGGAFKTVNQVEHPSLAAITRPNAQTPDGLLIPEWAPNPDGEVRALIKYPDKDALFVGGRFAHLGGQANKGLGGVSTTGTGATIGWSSSLNNATQPEVYCFSPFPYTLLKKILIVGGKFSIPLLQGGSIDHLAFLEWDTGKVIEAINVKPDGPIYTVAAIQSGSDKSIFVGGAFTQIGGVSDLPALARLSYNDADGKANVVIDSMFNFQLTNHWTNQPAAVHSIATTNDSLLIGGHFDQVNGADQPQFFKVNYSTGAYQLSSWNPHIQYQNGAVRSVLAYGQWVFLGGGFFSAGGSRHRYVAALNPAGQPIPNWNLETDGPVKALSVLNSELFLGGAFKQVNNSTQALVCPNAAKASAVDGTPANWCPGPDGPVNAVAAFNDSFYGVSVGLGGNFQKIKDLPNTGMIDRPYLVFVNPQTGQPHGFDPQANGVVEALRLHNNVLFAGGHFTQISGWNKAYAVGLDLTHTHSPYGLAPTAPVSAIAASGDLVYLTTDSITSDLYQGKLEVRTWATGAPVNMEAEVRGKLQALAAGSDWGLVGGAIFPQNNLAETPFLMAFPLNRQLSPWAPLLAGARDQLSAEVRAISASGNQAMFGGSFAGLTTQEHPNLLKMKMPVFADHQLFLPVVNR